MSSSVLNTSMETAPNDIDLCANYFSNSINSAEKDVTVNHANTTTSHHIKENNATAHHVKEIKWIVIPEEIDCAHDLLIGMATLSKIIAR